MFWKKRICPKCKTGKESYELDKSSFACPHIGCLKKNKCYFFVPLDRPSRKTFSSVQKNKLKTALKK